MTRTPLSTSKGQASKSPGCFTHRCVYAQAPAIISVETYWTWRNCSYGALCRRGSSRLRFRHDLWRFKNVLWL